MNFKDRRGDAEGTGRSRTTPWAREEGEEMIRERKRRRRGKWIERTSKVGSPLINRAKRKKAMRLG